MELTLCEAAHWSRTLNLKVRISLVSTAAGWIGKTLSEEAHWEVCWGIYPWHRGLYCAGQGASWISKPQREQGVSRAAQRWYYSCFKDCKHVHQKQKCSESDKPVSLLASLCLAYLHFSHLKYHERLSPHSLSVSIQWTEISALAIWLAINKSKEPKD